MAQDKRALIDADPTPSLNRPLIPPLNPPLTRAMTRPLSRALTRRRVLQAGAATLGTSLFGHASLAQAALASGYPSQPIKVVVPFSAGGSSDVQGRMLAEQLGRHFGKPAVVENRPGAGGHIGGRAVAEAAGDGHTILLGSIGLHATYPIYQKLPYDPGKDFKLLTVLAQMPHVVVAHPALPADSLADLARLARQKADAINFGSAGIGSSVHMIGELFRQKADAPMTHIPYKGSSGAMNDLLGGQIQVMFENPPTVLPHIRAGKLKALGVTGRNRLDALPEVRTGIESGFAQFEATSWTTVAVPASMPDAFADSLSELVRSIILASGFRKGLEEQGMTPVATARGEATAFTEAERAKWTAVIRAANLSA